MGDDVERSLLKHAADVHGLRLGIGNDAISDRAAVQSTISAIARTVGPPSLAALDAKASYLRDLRVLRGAGESENMTEAHALVLALEKTVA